MICAGLSAGVAWAACANAVCRHCDTSLFVGRNRTDRTLAARLGFDYRDEGEFFADAGD